MKKCTTLIIILCCLLLCTVILLKYGKAFSISSRLSESPCVKDGEPCHASGDTCCSTNQDCTTRTCPSSPTPQPSPAPQPSPDPVPAPAPVPARRIPRSGNSVVSYFKINKPDVKAVYVDVAAQFGFDYILDTFKKIVNAGFNVIILSFYILSGPADWTITWKQLSNDEKGRIKSYLAKNNVLLLASWGGSTGGGSGPNKCDWTWVVSMLNRSENMKDLQYDGIDLDFEWITQTGPNQGCMAVINTIYNTVESQYGGSDFIFTSAPQTPYFSSNWALDYFSLEKTYPTMFDWYNIQFYNNGETDMTITQTIANDIKNGGIPPEKIVVGKCNQGCAAEYFVGGKTLLDWTKTQGYRGVMLWEWYGNAAQWFS